MSGVRTWSVVNILEPPENKLIDDFQLAAMKVRIRIHVKRIPGNQHQSDPAKVKHA
jgi:hypothetical protein